MPVTYSVFPFSKEQDKELRTVFPCQWTKHCWITSTPKLLWFHCCWTVLSERNQSLFTHCRGITSSQFCFPLPETHFRAGSRYNNIQKKQACVTAVRDTCSEEVACLRLHREYWTKLATEASFPFWKTFANKHFAFLGSGSLLSFTECWALWCPAQYKCLRSHYSNMSISQEWASLPRGSPQFIPTGRIALSRLCHQRKCSDSKRLDAKTK